MKSNNNIMTISQLSKRSIYADRNGNILYMPEFAIESLVYYDLCMSLGIAASKYERFKVARERKKAEALANMCFKNKAEIARRESSLYSKAMALAKERCLVA